LRSALLPKLPRGELRSHDLKLRNASPDGFFVVRRGQHDFVPLVSQMRSGLVKVRIEIYRRQELGGIFDPGGDLDNQVATVLDGLRIPQDDNEAKSLGLPVNGRCFCFLEDDSLISVITIESRQLLGQLAKPEHARLQVHVEATPWRFR